MSTIDASRDQARYQQQRAINAQAPVFVRACPGAGKTRVLVERHLRAPAGPNRRGRALLSFTNVAADELRERCNGLRPDLTGFPHFIGTFDRFLWRYLVRPFLPAGPDWQHLHSWDQVPSALVGHREVPLSEFTFGYDPVTDQTRVRWSRPGGQLTHAEQSEQDYCDMARKLRDRLQKTRGYMTGHEIRVAALRNARDRGVTKLLGHRFFEIVVDEAQDCSVLDLAILEQLLEGGLPLVVVADPDQGIYEWNEARPQDLLELSTRLPLHLELNGNWRSSPPISRLAATLRPERRIIPDLSVGEHHALDVPLLLLPYGLKGPDAIAAPDLTAAVKAFTSLAVEEGIISENCLALGHSNTSVPRTGPKPTVKTPTKPDAKALAWATTAFTIDAASPDNRAQALELAGRCLLRYWHPESSGPFLTSLTEHDLPQTLMRRRAAHFLHALPKVDDTPARQWRKAAHAVLKAQLPPTGTRPPEPKPLSLARDDLGKPMRSLVGLPDTRVSEPSAHSMRGSTVHQAKGREADAVLIHVSRAADVTELVSAWTDPAVSTENSELLRVYYVAITRARQLIAFTYPRSRHPEVTTMLNTLNIDYRVESGSAQLAAF